MKISDKLFYGFVVIVFVFLLVLVGTEFARCIKAGDEQRKRYNSHKVVYATEQPSDIEQILLDKEGK